MNIRCSQQNAYTMFEVGSLRFVPLLVNDIVPKIFLMKTQEKAWENCYCFILLLLGVEANRSWSTGAAMLNFWNQSLSRPLLHTQSWRQWQQDLRVRSVTVGLRVWSPALSHPLCPWTRHFPLLVCWWWSEGLMALVHVSLTSVCLPEGNCGYSVAYVGMWVWMGDWLYCNAFWSPWT